MKYKYKFSYGSISNYLLSQYIIMSINFFISLWFIVLNYRLYNLFTGMFNEMPTLLLVTKKCFFVLGLLFFICLVVTFVIPKRVILTDDFIYVKRHFWNLALFFRGVNDKISLNNVIECKKYDGKRPRWNRQGPYAVFFFDWDDLVEITVSDDKDDKTYLVPIQNSEDFIKRVNERIKSNCL